MYPYVESLKVGAAYAVLLYIWPCIVFRNVLRKKGLTFRFLFCGMVQPVLLSTAVLTLGLFHILNVWVVRALFWGALAVSLLDLVSGWRSRGGALARLPLQALITGSHGWKLYFSRVVDAIAQRLKKIWLLYRKRAVEYFMLAVIILFGMAFFLNGAFQDYSFGCNDQYTHYRWTSALLRGEVFTAGVYPEGMHCFLYALHVLFGVKLHSCVLFLAGIHNSSAFLLAAYCLLKEIFHSRHTPLFVLTAWLTFDGIGANALESMSRMTWTLPLEFALYLVFLCPLLLLRYMREQDKPGKWYRDENLLLLMAGVAFAVSTHFYALSMVFCACCAVALVHYKEFWPARRLLAPVGAALYGVELGVLPMLAACAMGRNLEVSLLWGFNTLRGASSNSSVKLMDPTAAAYAVKTDYLKVLYENGYRHLFGEQGAAWLIVLSLLVPLLVAVYVYARRRGRLQGFVLPAGMAKGYLTLTVSLTVFMLLYTMPSMGLPELVVIDRTLGVVQMLAFGTIGILADLLIMWAERLRGKMLPRRWMVVGCLVLYCVAYTTDFHQCTYWWLRRYNAAVVVTDQIINNYTEGTYRVVSMMDEAYQVGDGSHEELITFLENTEGKDYSIPAEYIFLYVEKHPIVRGQVHFLTAPRWLAQENYEVYEGLWNQSQCPNILYREISQELVEIESPYYPNVQSNYNNQTIRTMLCSKAYSWYQEFSVTHPAETSVYYEDDDFVCYVIHQNQLAPLKLTVGGGDSK